MSLPVVATIDEARIPMVCNAQQFCEPVTVARHGDEVHVIWHQAVRQDVDACLAPMLMQ